MVKTIIYSTAQPFVKYCFHHQKIKFTSSSHRVIISSIYKNKTLTSHTLPLSCLSQQKITLNLFRSSQTKQSNSQEEAITSEIVAQAHLENKGMQIFLWADTEDRAARFNK